MSAGEQLSFDAEPEQAAAAADPERAPGPPEPADHPFPPTGEQAAAIGARDRDVFLEAGAGTGKTRVLVDRYCDAVDLDEIEPARILAFTFTEKAAAEMRRRVRVELMRRARAAEPGERRSRLEAAARAGEGAPITTIHGFCRRLLASHPVAAGLDPRFRVLDAAEARRLGNLAFERALERLASDDDDVARLAAGHRRNLGGLIAAAYGDLRNQGERTPRLPPLQISAFESKDDAPAEEAAIEFADASYGAMRRLLEAYGEEFDAIKADRSGVDFDDLQLLALELLSASQAIAAAYGERYDHLLVDEFQDTSPLQVELIRVLQGPGTRLFTVGDEFQSIYAFRGADLASFRRQRRLARESGGDEAVLPLSGSFRSTPQVVAAVNAIGSCLLEEFRELRVGREPVGAVAGPEPTVELLATERGGWKDEGIVLESAAAETEPNRVAEARVIARRLRELADEGVEPGSMVLLLRAFSHVDAYAEALELAGLDPYVVGGRGYWSAQQVEDALRLLACIANPLDDEALFGALASPACGASADALWILRRIAGRGRHIWPVIADHLLPERDEGGEPEDAGGGEPASTGGGEPASTGGGEPAGAGGGEPNGAGGGGAEEPEPEPDPEAQERREQAALWAGRLPAEDSARIERFATRLVELREGAPLLPLDSLVERSIESFGYDLAALAMPGGKRRAANLLKLIRIAAEYEAHEGRDLRGFLSYASERAALSDREAEAAVAAEEHEGVTIMTVHAAKGLEFECVAVGDLGRGMSMSGSQPGLRLAFGAADQAGGGDEPPNLDSASGDDGDGDEDEDEDEDQTGSGPRVGLRLARAGAPALTLEGFSALSDEAAAADARESGRLAYVAASRARSRLILSGLYDPVDLEGGRPELRPSHSVLARLLPALGATDQGEQVLPLAAAEPRTGLELDPEPAGIAVRVIRASAETAKELSRDDRGAGGEEEPAPGGRPPMPALSERGASAARSLSYAALADYNRCGYRFLTERVLGLSYQAPASAPTDDPGSDGDEGRELDEEPTDPGPDPEAAPRRRTRLGFGRAVHELLEQSARDRWRRPSTAEVEAALAGEGVDPEEAGRAGELVAAWLDSPQLAELRETGARFRPEVPFRVELGGGTVLRGTIDLLVEREEEPPLVIDYKTDARVPAAGELADGYLIQRALYSHAIAAATGAERVASSYFFLADPAASVDAVLGMSEIAAGRERIEELIRRIRERDFAVTHEPGAALCHDCPARARLCPHPPERTLAR